MLEPICLRPSSQPQKPADHHGPSVVAVSRRYRRGKATTSLSTTKYGSSRTHWSSRIDRREPIKGYAPVAKNRVHHNRQRDIFNNLIWRSSCICALLSHVSIRRKASNNFSTYHKFNPPSERLSRVKIINPASLPLQPRTNIMKQMFRSSSNTHSDVVNKTRV